MERGEVILRIIFGRELFKLKDYSIKKLVGIIILNLLLASLVFSGELIKLTDGQAKLLSKLQKQGLLSIEPNLNKAYIDPGLWQSMKYSLKEDFAATLAIYCANKKGTQSFWVDVYDQYSGKQLAKYSRSWGFKVY
jgi:hypothetical protein